MLQEDTHGAHGIATSLEHWLSTMSTVTIPIKKYMRSLKLFREKNVPDAIVLDIHYMDNIGVYINQRFPDPRVYCRR
ncbi:MAG: hypothetical protein U5K54_23925 [Cytophagales bacterium]|nr:hypothetical protein [Cytophagales bacterium]